MFNAYHQLESAITRKMEWTEPGEGIKATLVLLVFTISHTTGFSRCEGVAKAVGSNIRFPFYMGRNSRHRSIV